MNMRATNGDDGRASRRPLARPFRRFLLGALAVVIGVAGAFGLYGVSVQPGAAIVKMVFESKPEVTPPSNFDRSESLVKKAARISIRAAGAPVSHLDLYVPKSSSGPVPVILWIHGGGFISSSADTVRDYAVLLASKGYAVGNLDYSLAPGARYPVPVDQANAALAYLSENASSFGGDSDRIFIGGDSAGAQIAAELGAVQTNPELASQLHLTPGAPVVAIRGMVLFCGLYDMRTVAKTGFPALRTYLWAYTGKRDWSNVPYLDDLSATSTARPNYPPTFLTVGDKDPFHTQGTEFATRLEAQGVSVTKLLWDGSGAGLGHEYQFDFSLPQARTALAETEAFLTNRSER